MPLWLPQKTDFTCTVANRLPIGPSFHSAYTQRQPRSHGLETRLTQSHQKLTFRCAGDVVSFAAVSQKWLRIRLQEIRHGWQLLDSQ